MLCPNKCAYCNLDSSDESVLTEPRPVRVFLPGLSALVTMSDLSCLACSKHTSYHGFDDGLFILELPTKSESLAFSWVLLESWWGDYGEGFEAYRRSWGSYLRRVASCGYISSKEVRLIYFFNHISSS